MRITALRQLAKSVAAEDADLGGAADRLLEKVKHYLWHGNVFQAQIHMGMLEDHLEGEDASRQLLAGLREFRTYIDNNASSIPNYGERYRQGETISTAFVESTVNQLVNKRMSKKQQMRWSHRGAHLLLQARTKVLNGSLEEDFWAWYPAFRRAACPPAFWQSPICGCLGRIGPVTLLNCRPSQLASGRRQPADLGPRPNCLPGLAGVTPGLLTRPTSQHS